jgi:ketosteroid isomerase-like protein
MSRDDVEIVRRVFDAIARRDSAAVLALYDPHVEIEVMRGAFAEFVLGEGVYRGYEGLRTVQRALSEAFASIETICEELIDAGRHVLSASRYRARGRGSGIEVEGPLQYGVWTIRDGKIARVVWFSTRAEALEATSAREAAENIETVRRILDAWGQGDFRTQADALDPDIAFETFMPDAVENVVARGSAQLEAFTREWLAQWRDYRVVGEEFRVIGPDRVFVSVRQVGTGGHSDVEVDSPGYTVWRLRDGKVVELSLHYDRGEALGTAGLTE